MGVVLAVARANLGQVSGVHWRDVEETDRFVVVERDEDHAFRVD
jgi:hypothetical protein